MENYPRVGTNEVRYLLHLSLFSLTESIKTDISIFDAFLVDQEFLNVTKITPKRDQYSVARSFILDSVRFFQFFRFDSGSTSDLIS